MPEPENLYDRVILAIVKRVPGRVVLALTFLLWPGAGLVLPLALGWPALWLVEANVTGTLLAASLAFGWLFVQIQARDRRHLLEWTSDLRLLDGAEFEWLVGEVFRREGWKVEETGRQDAADGNVDLALTRGNERRLVQCKRWTAKWVGVEEIRGFAGALLREGLPGTAGMFVTLSDFTEQARAEAKASGIEVIDNRDLFERVERVRRAEPCAICGRPMVLGRSVHGWWFRCVTAGCAGKRDLGRDPARAIAIITDTE